MLAPLLIFFLLFDIQRVLQKMFNQTSTKKAKSVLEKEKGVLWTWVMELVMRPWTEVIREMEDAGCRD